MTWVTPETWANNVLVLASKLNRMVVQNMAWLKSRPFNSVTIDAIVNTTSTSFVEVTGATTTVTSFGGNMLIAACGVSSTAAAGATVTYDLAIDGVRQGNATTGLVQMQSPIGGYPDNASVIFLTSTPPSAGAHVYTLHWKTSSSTTSAITRLFAIELR